MSRARKGAVATAPQTEGEPKMIATSNEAMKACAKYRDADGFCARNCSCSGLGFCANGPQRAAAREEALAAGVGRYNVMTGACGDVYVVTLDENGRLL